VLSTGFTFNKTASPELVRGKVIYQGDSGSDVVAIGERGRGGEGGKNEKKEVRMREAQVLEGQNASGSSNLCRSSRWRDFSNGAVQMGEKSEEGSSRRTVKFKRGYSRASASSEMTEARF